jgi:hypothetical protein
MKKRVATSLSIFLILLAGCGGDPQPGDQSLSADTSSQLDNQPEVQAPAANAAPAPEKPPVTDKNEDEPAADFTPGVFRFKVGKYPGGSGPLSNVDVHFLNGGKATVTHLREEAPPSPQAASWRIIGDQIVMTHEGGSKSWFYIGDTNTLIPTAHASSSGQTTKREPKAPELLRRITGPTGKVLNPAKPDIRTWKDATGQFNTEGGFLRISGDQVILQTTDDKEISVTWDKLSIVDHEYIKAQLIYTPDGRGERKSVDALEALGSAVTFRAGHVYRVNVRGPKVSNLTLLYLTGFPNLERLSLPPITDDAGMEHLKGLTNLKAIDVEGTQITDAGLVHLRKLTNLTKISLFKTNITDTGLANLAGLTELETLGLGETQITDAGLVHLKNLTRLEWLSLGFSQITDTGLENLKELTNLRTLVLHATQISDAGLEHLMHLKNLRMLALAQTNVTDAGVADLQKALPNCKISH